MSENSTTNELIGRAQAGDRSAFAQLVDLYRGPMYAACRRYNRRDAEDVLQSALIKLWLGIGQYRGDGTFQAYACQIAHNEAVRSLRRKEWPLLGDPPAEEIDPFAGEEVRAGIESLPPHQQDILRARDIEGVSMAELALMLGVSEPVARVYHWRARQALKERLLFMGELC